MELRRFVRAFFPASLHPVSHRVHVVRRCRTLSHSKPYRVVPTFGKMPAVGYCHSHAHLSLHVRISCPAFRPPTSVPAFSRGSPSSCYAEPHTLQAPVLPHTGCSAFLITNLSSQARQGNAFQHLSTIPEKCVPSFFHAYRTIKLVFAIVPGVFIVTRLLTSSGVTHPRRWKLARNKFWTSHTIHRRCGSSDSEHCVESLRVLGAT